MSERKHDIATREEVLALLTDQARKGSPTAAATLGESCASATRKRKKRKTRRS